MTRAHLIAWRDELGRRGLGGATIRHRLASLASLFEDLCEKNAVTHNPVKGVERPKTESGEGKTPAIGDHQARPARSARRGDRQDRAILSTLLFHALRREELRKLGDGEEVASLIKLAHRSPARTSPATAILTRSVPQASRSASAVADGPGKRCGARAADGSRPYWGPATQITPTISTSISYATARATIIGSASSTVPLLLRRNPAKAGGGKIPSIGARRSHSQQPRRC